MSSTASSTLLRLSAVVLDFDGVVLDSETAEFESHRAVFERYGVALSPAEWRVQIGVFTEGQRQRWHHRLLECNPDGPTLDQFEADVRERFRQLLPAAPMTGILDMLDALDQVRVPVAIATAAPANWVVPAAARIGIAARVRTIVSADDVPRRKPAPDVYLEALRRLGVDRGRSIAIEDSGPGIAAACAAGLTTVAIPHWLTEHHDLSGAHLRVSSASELNLDVLDALLAGT